MFGEMVGNIQTIWDKPWGWEMTRVRKRRGAPSEAYSLTLSTSLQSLPSYSHRICIKRWWRNEQWMRRFWGSKRKGSTLVRRSWAGMDKRKGAAWGQGTLCMIILMKGRSIHYLLGPSVSQATPWSITCVHGGYSVNIIAVTWTKNFQRNIHG